MNVARLRSGYDGVDTKPRHLADGVEGLDDPERKGTQHVDCAAYRYTVVPIRDNIL